MSAKAAFLEAYNDPGRCFCGGAGLAGACESFEDLVDALLASHARELAKKIRDMERRNAWPERHGACGAVLPSQVADFIDPEVSS
ncbi:hypothetical protein [Streptomyces cinereoruber]|uniref:hypothetical protein n=1 Tax=Streptomyces cinereoruber TaxID=67260 RepID=UPI003C2BD1B5